MPRVKVPASSSSVLISCPQLLLVVFLHDLSRVCVEGGKEGEKEREGGGSGASTCPATNSLIRPLINTVQLYALAPNANILRSGISTHESEARGTTHSEQYWTRPLLLQMPIHPHARPELHHCSAYRG